jgi:[amino group carrier protein]-L-2-aminoadipate/L-glutamate 6-kinase
MIIVKIGGGSTINIEGVIKDIAEIKEEVIIIHGANALRDELAEKLGRPKKVVTSVSGYSSVFSDESAIDVMMMAYAGLRNKRIVELCQRSGINAVGLTGLDGRLVQGKRNAGIRVREGGKTRILHDFSGKPQSINTGLLKLLLGNDYVPVISVPIADENGVAINSENDDIVGVLQEAMAADTIVQLIEAPGFLDDPDDESTLVREMSGDELARREEQVQGRMKRKMLALKKLLVKTGCQVIIADGRRENPLMDALNHIGTVIK